METSQFIDQLSAGDSAEAKETLNNILSTKAFESLEAKKIELARNIFNGSEESVEVQDTEEV
jgi:hypothetical protein